MSDDERRQRPTDLTPRAAWERYVNQRRSGSTDDTIKTYYYRLKLFVEWCEERGLEAVGELDGWELDEYRAHRSGAGVAPTTLQGEMQTLKNFLEYLERIELVDEGLAERVDVPRPTDAEASDDTMLAEPDAVALLNHYRNEPGAYGTRGHAWLEVAWHTGARASGLRALDVRDVYLDPDEGEAYVDFVHRPETGTGLKRDLQGERPVGIPPAVRDVLERYLEHHRPDKYDDHGRQPLFPSRHGRPVRNTMRVWSYRATFPCHHGPCPHGRDRASCAYFQDYHQASKCPSSRAPHHVRTGSITWQRDLGFPPEVVAERVNASIPTIKQYYDKARALDRLERRRRSYVNRMTIDDN